MRNDRIRKVNVETMSTEQADSLSTQLGSEIDKKLVAVKNELNKMLGVYGLELELGFQIKQKEKV